MKTSQRSPDALRSLHCGNHGRPSPDGVRSIATSLSMGECPCGSATESGRPRSRTPIRRSPGIRHQLPANPAGPSMRRGAGSNRQPKLDSVSNRVGAQHQPLQDQYRLEEDDWRLSVVFSAAIAPRYHRWWRGASGLERRAGVEPAWTWFASRCLAVKLPTHGAPGGSRTH